MLHNLETVSHPFVYFERNATTGAIITPKKENDDTIVISGIMNNKAYIDGSWKRVGEKVGDYTIGSIGINAVILSNGRKSKNFLLVTKR